ncbi:MAG: ABC transporter permease [Spirochaetaceae bacterium]
MMGSLIGIATPFLIAALGGLFTERAGVLNIALEGLMLIGAFAAVTTAGLTGSLIYGLAAGIGASTILSFLFAEVSLRLRANIFIAGLAINLFASGSTAMVSKAVFNTRGVLEFSDFPSLTRITVPLLSEIPLVGFLFTGQTLFTYTGLLLVPLAGYILYRTPFGLRVRAAGFGEEALFVRGVSPLSVRTAALTISGFACGIAGAAVALPLGAYIPHLTAGRGWIALVAIFLGYKRPLGILAASLLFAGAEWASYSIQGAGILPSSLLLGVPFFITFVGMVIFSAATHSYRHR